MHVHTNTQDTKKIYKNIMKKYKERKNKSYKTFILRNSFYRNSQALARDLKCKKSELLSSQYII